MKYAAILAGGRGSRMGKVDMPKQFLMLGDKPIIIHTLEQFYLSNYIDKIIVAVPKDWFEYMNDIIKKYMIDYESIDIIIGGVDRNSTIMNICNHIDNSYKINADDIVITHDSVRPFVNQRIIKDNVEQGLLHDAVDTVIPTFDTLVESLNHEDISSIPIRENFYLGQTPQTFKIKVLMNIYSSLTQEQKELLTDACKMFVLNKKNVKIVKGEQFNMKITTKYDLKLANMLLETNKND